MKIEPSKTYLTSGDYVVVIAKGKDGSLLSTVETSPGVMYSGKNIYEANVNYTGRNNDLGWDYSIDGQCTSPNDEWREKLRITEELPFSLPTLPTGYKWKGDFPQYRVPVLGEHVIAWSGENFINRALVCDKDFLSCTTLDLRRLIVESISVASRTESSTSPTRYYKLTPRDTALFVKRVGNKMGFVYANDLDSNLRYNWNISDENEVKKGKWKEITKEEADKIIMESKTPEKPDLTESGKYKLLGSGDKFTKGVTECDSHGTFIKCNYSGNVSSFPQFNFRDPVASPIPASPVPDGMVEVTHLPDYILKRNGDGYLSAEKYFTYVSRLNNNKEFSVQWFLDISKTDYKLYTTKENYNEWLASQEAQRKKKVDESRAKLLSEMRNTTVKINGEEIKGAKVSDPVTTFASTTGLVIPTNNDQVWLKSPVVKSGIGRRAFNYWLGDPIKTITKEVKAALPYVVLGGSAWGITYTVFHIEEIKDLYNKHVPSVSISIDAPEILSQ